MVESIGSSSFYQYQSQYSTSTSSLTDEQKSLVEEILANYDSESITEEETKTLLDELKSTGIEPSKEMDEIFEAAGFKNSKRPEGKPPAGGMGGSQPPQYALDLMEKVQSGEISEEDVTELLKNLSANDEDTSGVFVNKTV